MKNLLLFPVILVNCILYGQSNYALSFNGTTQYASIGAPIQAGSSYTKEAWIFATTLSGNRNILSSANHPFWVSGGILQAGQTGNYSRVVDNTTLPPNTWVHTAVTFDASTSTMCLYKNGTLISTATSVPAYTSENIYAGSHSGGNSLFEGLMDEVRIWNVALSAAQLKAYMLKGPPHQETGLLAYYPCNEGTGASLVNVTGGTNGTLVNSPTWVASPVGFSGNALSFDGVNDVVNIADHSSLDITNAITLEAWVYATKSSGIQNVMNKSSNAVNTGYIFPRTDNGWGNVVMYLHIGGGWRTLSAPYPGLNAWHHLAATYDGAMMRLYINGVEAASQAYTGAITTNNNFVTLGNQTGFSEFFGGRADEFRIWNVARTQAEIHAGMNRELDPSQHPGLVSYYTMNQGIASGTNTGMVHVVDQAGSNNGTMVNFGLSGTSSNFVTQKNNLITLPLEWLSFSAAVNDNDVLLRWSTTHEVNVQNFIVQHSTDGRKWKGVGNVEASGNDAQPAGGGSVINSYEFAHHGAAPGVHYYRVMQRDADGQYTYSQVRSVRIAATDAAFRVLNNPVMDGILKVRLGADAMLRLYDVRGVSIWQGQGRAGVAEIAVGRFASGVYWLRAGERTERVVVR